jgi:hypothetical protein
MDCPKCKAKLTDFNGASFVSPLGGNHNAVFISGMSCLICGTWVEPDIKPVCPMPGKERLKVKKEQAQTYTFKCVAFYFDSVKKMVDEGTNINNIAKILSKAVRGGSYTFQPRAIASALRKIDKEGLPPAANPCLRGHEQTIENIYPSGACRLCAETLRQERLSK